MNALKKSSTIRTLRLHFPANRLDDTAAELLSELGGEPMESLTELVINVRWNKITDAGAGQLRILWQRRPNRLQKLSLSIGHNPLTSIGLGRLQDETNFFQGKYELRFLDQIRL